MYVREFFFGLVWFNLCFFCCCCFLLLFSFPLFLFSWIGVGSFWFRCASEYAEFYRHSVGAFDVFAFNIKFPFLLLKPIIFGMQTIWLEHNVSCFVLSTCSSVYVCLTGALLLQLYYFFCYYYFSFTVHTVCTSVMHTYTHMYTNCARKILMTFES